jgi:hypothetical protein
LEELVEYVNFKPGYTLFPWVPFIPGILEFGKIRRENKIRATKKAWGKYGGKHGENTGKTREVCPQKRAISYSLFWLLKSSWIQQQILDQLLITILLIWVSF